MSKTTVTTTTVVVVDDQSLCRVDVNDDDNHIICRLNENGTTSQYYSAATTCHVRHLYTDFSTQLAKMHSQRGLTAIKQHCTVISHL